MTVVDAPCHDLAGQRLFVRRRLAEPAAPIESPVTADRRHWPRERCAHAALPIEIIALPLDLWTVLANR